MEKTDSERTYNGWTNYETWAVALWLDNEEETYRYWRDQAARHRLAAEHLTEIQQGVVTSRQAAIGNLAQQLKEEITDASPLFEPTMYSDLLWAALSEVDWLEIADHLLTE